MADTVLAESHDDIAVDRRDRPTVLHVLEALEGGTSRHVVDVVRWAHGVRHVVAVPPKRVGGVTDRAALAALRGAGATVYLVDMRRSPMRPENLAAMRHLRRLLDSERPDVVHGHSSVGGALARIAAWDAPAARVYTPNGVMTAGPVVTAERRLGRRTDRLVAVSESEGELVRRLRLVPADRVVVIPNGIDTHATPQATVDLRAELGVPAGTPLVGSVARLVPQKAPEDLVRLCDIVAARNDAAHFVLIGDGPDPKPFERALATASLGSRFHHLRSLPGASGVLGQLDVFVLPSRFEGGPYTPLEAMRAGTPVVLSDCVGNRDAVVHGESGLLASVGDAPGLAAAVTLLLEEPRLGTALAKAAKARVRATFDVRDMGTALSALYARLASRTAARR